MIDETFTLTLSWEDVRKELDSLAAGPVQREMVAHLVRPLQVQARFLTQGLILREILSIAACIANMGFPPDGLSGD